MTREEVEDGGKRFPIVNILFYTITYSRVKSML
jgi:hypothetical protein